MRFGQGFWSLFLFRIGVGVGEAALSPTAYSIITDYFDKGSLARALDVYTISVTIGSGLAYIIGGWVVTMAIGVGTVNLPFFGPRERWQLTFFLVGLPGLAVAALVLLIREPKHKGLIRSGGTIEPVSIRETIDFMAKRHRAYATHIIGLSLFVIVVFSVNFGGLNTSCAHSPLIAAIPDGHLVL